MKKKILSLFLITVLVLSMLSGCGGSSENNDSTSDSEENTLEAASVESMEALTVEYKKADEYKDWSEESYTKVVLNNDTIDVDGNGASATDAKLEITSGGYYVISGELTDGSITINASDKDKVYLILNNASIACSDGAAIVENSADKVIISLVEGSVNTISDGKTEETDAPTAAIYCEDSLTINGTGTLNVTGNNNDAITSKDALKIMEGTINVSAVDDGIIGRDWLIIKDGTITVNVSGDGLKTTKINDTENGIVYIEGGEININSGTDGIQAENIVKIIDGNFNIVTGGSSTVDSSTAKETPSEGETPSEMTEPSQGEMPSDMAQPSGGGMPSDMAQPSGGEMPSDMTQPSGGEMPSDMTQPSQGETSSDMQKQGNPGGNKNGGWGQWQNGNETEDDTSSAKGIKSVAGIYISAGTFNIDSSDDSVHTNGNASICGGTFAISSGDDGMHADSDMEISGGTIDISKSYEGIEGANVIITDGKISIVASDDGINAAGGNDGSSTDGRPGMNNFENSDSYTIDIRGGEVEVNADGDGVDSNGALYMSGGKVVVHGPASGGNGILDYNSEFKMTGGTLLCDGGSDMFQTISASSTQNCINYSGGNYSAETEIKVYDGDDLIASYTAKKSFSTIIVSTPELVAGNKYTVVIGDESIELEAQAGGEYTENKGF